MTLPTHIRLALVLFAAITIDVVYVYYIRAVAVQQIPAATVLSMVLGAISMLSLKEVLRSKWAMAVWIIGLGLGTAIGMGLGLI